MDEALLTPPTSKLNFSEQIHCVQLSPFEWSQRLICVALGEEIVVGTINFQDEDEVMDDNISYTVIRTFHHETRVHAIAWSPDTSLSVVPKVVSFCVAGADFKIRLYNSNLNDINVYETPAGAYERPKMAAIYGHKTNYWNRRLVVLDGHRDYVNAVAFESEGELLASVSDDHTCKLWAVKEEEKYVSSFHLTSPGMSVCWHSEESGKLLVAEKNGLMHMYNVRSQQAIMSLDAGAVPLTSADWGPNPLKVVCLAAGELLLWDVSRPSRPTESRTLHVEGGLTVKFSTSNENLVASVGRPDNLIKVTNLRTNQVVLCGKVNLIGGITWHHKLPYLCAASDRQLLFWRINVK